MERRRSRHHRISFVLEEQLRGGFKRPVELCRAHQKQLRLEKRRQARNRIDGDRTLEHGISLRDDPRRLEQPGRYGDTTAT